MVRFSRFVFLLFVHAALAQPVTLIDAPVRVTVEAQKDARIESGTTALSIEAQDRNQAFRFRVSSGGTRAEAVARQKTVTGFRTDSCSSATIALPTIQRKILALRTG